jgi:hypothetical protein
MPEITMVQTVLTLVEGLVYAPWVNAALLFGVVPVVLARCWRVREYWSKNNNPLSMIVFVGFLSVAFELPLWSRSTPKRVRKKPNFTNQIQC